MASTTNDEEQQAGEQVCLSPSQAFKNARSVSGRSASGADNGDNESSSSHSEISMDFINKVVVDYLRQRGINTVSSTANSSSLDTSSSSSEERVALSDGVRDNTGTSSRRGTKRSNNQIKTQNLSGRTRNTSNTYTKNNSKDSLESSTSYDSADDEREEDTSDSAQDACQNQKRRTQYSLTRSHLHEHDQEQHQRMLDNNEWEEQPKRKLEGTALISEKRQKNSHQMQDRVFASRRDSQEVLSSESGMSEPGDSEDTSSSSDSGNSTDATGNSLSESHYSSPSHTDTNDSSSSDSLSTQRKVHTITDASIATSSGS